MLPFRVELKAGESPYRQVVYAATRAIVAGQLRPGDRFPSVREISKALRINPNTAHKVISSLVNDGLIEVRPGIGTVVGKAPAPTRRERAELLTEEVERLVVESKRLSLDLDDVVEAVRKQWNRLSERKEETAGGNVWRRSNVNTCPVRSRE
jgi:GntR family transcriptional regulator